MHFIILFNSIFFFKIYEDCAKFNLFAVLMWESEIWWLELNYNTFKLYKMNIEEHVVYLPVGYRLECCEFKPET